MEIPSADIDRLSTESPVVNGMAIPNPTADTTAGIVLNNQVKAAELNAQLQNAAIEIEAPKPEAPDTEAETPDTELSEGNKPETGKDDAAIEGNGDGNESYTYTYDKRGNRTAEIGKKASRSYVYDETNRMVEGTNWKGDKSAYTYNGLGIRINNTHTTHAGKVYARDYVIDYTSFENDDLMVFAEGNGQLEYEQKHVYAGSERIEQFTDKGNWERTLYVHEDVMGNTRYYTKANGQSFAELTYDAWGMPVSPNKLLNNDHGNYVFATFTGHIYDTTLDIYFAEARFYDASNRTWLAMDPIKDGLNWYQYCYSNPTTYWDPLGLKSTRSKQSKLSGSAAIDPAMLGFSMALLEDAYGMLSGMYVNGVIAYGMLPLGGFLAIPFIPKVSTELRKELDTLWYNFESDVMSEYVKEIDKYQTGKRNARIVMLLIAALQMGRGIANGISGLKNGASSADDVIRSGADILDDIGGTSGAANGPVKNDPGFIDDILEAGARSTDDVLYNHTGITNNIGDTGAGITGGIAGSGGNASQGVLDAVDDILKGSTVVEFDINKLSRSQQKAIESADNIINDHLKSSDLSAALGDLQGNPIERPDGSYWNHAQEVKDAYRGLVRAKNTLTGSLQNPNLDLDVRAYIQDKYDSINSYIKVIEEMFAPYGGID